MCLFRLLSPLHFKPVSHTPYGLYILRMRSVILDLFSDFLNMHSNCGNISDRLHIPDLTEQLFLCVHMVRMPGQKCQQVKFLCCKGPFLPVHPHPSGCSVYLKPADLYNLVFLCIAADQTLISCKMRLTRATSSLGLNGFVM